jgi:hypothetical protein
MTFRRFLEHSSRGVVLRRRIPARFGRLPIYVTPEASLRYWSAMSRVDSVLYGMAEEPVKPGAVVWDLGANVGLLSLCAAATSGHIVLSIETRFLACTFNRPLLPRDCPIRMFEGAGVVRLNFEFEPHCKPGNCRKGESFEQFTRYDRVDSGKLPNDMFSRPFR